MDARVRLDAIIREGFPLSDDLKQELLVNGYTDNSEVRKNVIKVRRAYMFLMRYLSDI